MIQINFNYEDYKFSSINEKDVVELNEWIINNGRESSSCTSLDPQILYRRFLEYYFTEDEVYLKINKANNMIGIFKGRIEENSRFFIWLFIIDKELRNKGIGSKLLEELTSYLEQDKGIKDIRVGVAESNQEAIAFWKRCYFKIDRISKNFFEGPNSQQKDMIIMKRE